MLFKKLLPTGAEAPAFNLLDHQGQMVRSDSITRPKGMVLVFYTHIGDGACIRQFEEIQEHYGGFIQRELVVLAINPGDWEKQHHFAKKHRFPFQLLYDPHARIAKKYRATLIPGYLNRHAVYGIDWNGKICFACPGRPSLDDLFLAFDKRK